MRNNYIHLADAHGETQGIVWYMFNFCLWIAKKEYPTEFSELNYIGNDEIKAKFE